MLKRENVEQYFPKPKIDRCWLIILSLRKLERWSLSRGIILEEFFLIDEIFFFRLFAQIAASRVQQFFKSSVIIAQRLNI